MTTNLLIIDPQYDFCDQEGSLYVTGAAADCGRIELLIANNMANINDILVTMDAHPDFHIGHPIWFKNSRGEHPNPFSQIRLDGTAFIDQNDTEWQVTCEHTHDYTVNYLKIVKEHTVWPYHCVDGTIGSSLSINDGLQVWAKTQMAVPVLLRKGQSPFTECYSAIKDVTGRLTDISETILTSISKADKTIVCGEASSHCVAATVRDILRTSPEFAKKLIILSNCMSHVTGFRAVAENFFNQMREANVQVSTTDEISGNLRS